MTKIFLCYRSGDDAYAATLLDEKLSAVVGRQNVFRDNRSVEPGQNTEDLTLWQETWWDGSVELDVVRRNQDGTITGRLSGRAHPGDFARMAELVVRHTGDRDDVETGRTL
jgi:hypothetical protein